MVSRSGLAGLVGRFGFFWWAMPSIFAGLAESARAAHDHYFGEQVSLAEPGTATRNERAVLGRTRAVTRETDQGQRRVTVRDCRFIGLSTLRHDAVVTIDGAEWSIEEITNRSASGIECVLSRFEAYEVARQGYRGKG